MSEYKTSTGVVIKSMAFEDKAVDDALGLKELTIRVTAEGLEQLKSAAATEGAPLRAFVRKALERSTGFNLSFAAETEPARDTREWSENLQPLAEELVWPEIHMP